MSVLFHARQTLVALFFLAAIGLATPLWAQKDAGTIVGVVRDPKMKDRYTEAIRLFDLLLKPGQPTLQKARDEIVKLLVEGGESASVLWASLLQYYDVARVDPVSFKNEQRPQLNRLVRINAFKPMVEDLERVFAGAGLVEREQLLFHESQEVREFFRNWRPLLMRELTITRFARLLQRVADYGGKNHCRPA
jgi:hypothetical protein